MTLGRQHHPVTPRRVLAVTAVLALLLAAACVLSLSVGSSSIPAGRIFGILAGAIPPSEPESIIVLQLRLPRIILAAVIGAGLSVAGVVFQAMLRNPLAEPFILGISSGGTAGVLLALALSLSVLMISAFAFCGALLVAGLVYWLGHTRGKLDSHTLLLSGVMAGAFFNAIVLLMVALMHQEMRNAFLWLMGNLSGGDGSTLLIAGPVILVAAVILAVYARELNLLAAGEETAHQLGVHVVRVKQIAYVGASLITGMAVSVSGVVGFVGLIVPHACRLVLGPDHRLLLPAAFFCGGAFLVLADLAARTVIAPVEIPVGAVTAVLGAPVFVYLLKQR